MAAGALLVFLCLLDPAVAQVTDEAGYRVRFEATWSAESHPQDFPPNPHFSGLIGGVHGDGVRFWSDGGMASPGIEAMAEMGATTPLDLEVQAAVDAGTAREVVSGGGVGSSPGGSARAFFRASRTHPRLTLVTMVAPSPDWFVGVDSLDLFVGGDWAQEIIVPLYAWDAGTDDGVTFTSRDANTNPQEPIRAITDGPLGNGEPMGRFVITRLDASDPEALVLRDGRFRITATWLNFEGVRGRARAVPLTEDSGYLWFFDQGNVEVMVKVLDACTYNDRFWVYAGGLTSVEVEMRVEDTATGQVNVYANPLGAPFQPIQDSSAFATCP